MKVCSGGRVGARGGVLTRQARVARVGTKPAARQGRRSQGHHSEEHGRQQKIVRAFALAEDGAEEATEEENLGIFGKASDATFELKFVWGKDVLAFAVDQVLGKGNSSPLTEYFFWPQDDAWENLKAVLESKDWIPASEKIAMLNRVTEVINFWTPQESEEQNSTEQAQAKFPDCNFVGTFY